MIIITESTMHTTEKCNNSYLKQVILPKVSIVNVYAARKPSSKKFVMEKATRVLSRHAIMGQVKYWKYLQ